MKLGQYLALRFDLLPPGIIEELNQLFDRAPLLDFDCIRNRVERELGGRLEEFFRSFSAEPLGAASIAQVHRAVAMDGEEVAVKVQRPGVAETFASDMRNLLRLARLIDRLGLLASISARELVQEFADFTYREMDFRQEAATAELLGKEMIAGARAPRIRWDLTTERLLTMEYVAGVSLLRICELAAAGKHEEMQLLLNGIDIRKVMTVVTQASLHQIFVAGRFHGDPHFANILIRPDGTPVFIDWGIHGELSDDQRELLRDYIESWTRGDLARSAYCYLHLSTPTQATDLPKYKQELIEVLRGWSVVSHDPDATPEERHIARWQGEVVRAMQRNSVRMMTDQLLFWRAITVLEASVLKLPFRFDLVSELADFFARYRPSSLAHFAELSSRPGLLIDWAELVGTQLASAREALRRGQKGATLTCLQQRKRPAARTNHAVKILYFTTLLACLSVLFLPTARVYLLQGGGPVSLALLAMILLTVRH
jgi:ubiquinone biosynthesis protein